MKLFSSLGLSKYIILNWQPVWPGLPTGRPLLANITLLTSRFAPGGY
jgi:hypothetical protein